MKYSLKEITAAAVLALTWEVYAFCNITYYTSYGMTMSSQSNVVFVSCPAAKRACTMLAVIVDVFVPQNTAAPIAML
jgi:hypothetical protein